MTQLRRSALACMFQSAPGHEARGNVEADSARLPITTCFNPPPATRPGETLREARPADSANTCFNPPPATRPGETRCVRQRLDADCYVSIRPRPRGQGKPTVGSISWSEPSTRFNPPPATRPGETGRSRDAGMRDVSFNPPPATRPGETSSPAVDPVAIPMVSIRPRPRGQGKPLIAAIGIDRVRSRCFNPPPATRPGETPMSSGSDVHASSVSIRPRPRGQGKPRRDDMLTAR